MSVKALRNQLLAAIAMVLVAALALGSSTFAWFAVNTEVTATDMQVLVKSDTTFLLIQSEDETSGTTEPDQALSVQTKALTTKALTVNNADADVYPSKPWAAGDSSSYSNAATQSPTPVTTYTTAYAPGNWITANSTDPAKAVTNITGDKVLTAFTDYVIRRSAYLTLSKGSENAHNLTVTGQILPNGLEEATGIAESSKTYYTYAAGKYTKAALSEGASIPASTYSKTAAANDPTEIDISAAKVLVVTDDDNYVILDQTMNGTAQSLHSFVDKALTSDSVIHVDLYIYYDGSVSAVTSNNKANLGNATINLAFNVDVGNPT